MTLDNQAKEYFANLKLANYREEYIAYVAYKDGYRAALEKMDAEKPPAPKIEEPK